MKLSLLANVATVASVATVVSFGFAVGCATSERTVYLEALPLDGGPTAEGGSEAGAQEDVDDPANQPPHSLGTITLGETHGSAAATTSTPIVSAVFVPDALLTKTCKKKLEAGCEIQEMPKCGSGASTSSSCSSGEVCAFDDSCKAVCKKVPVCDDVCTADEVCTLTTTLGSTSRGTCVKRDSFDAGPLAFGGTTTSITMYPPYKFTSTGQGAPFLAGAELQVQAQGATEAGFEKFDEKFKATTFIQTNPTLSKIPREVVFSREDLPISWVPGNDTIVVSVTGTGGTATCKVDDALGKFEIPRSVVQAAQGDSTTSSTSLSISVGRQKKDVKKDKKAKGKLATGTVHPEGWLELVTLSTESHTFQGCAATQTVCKDTCCSSGQTCQAGVCTTASTSCSTCLQNASLGACSSQRSSCVALSSCSSLLSCVQTCTTASCINICESNYPAGASAFAPLRSCLLTQCSSYCP